MTVSNYKAIFRNWDGEKLYQFAGAAGELGGLTSIVYNKPANKVGTHAVTIKGDVSVADDIEVDYFVDIQRRPRGTTTWVRDYIGFHRTWVWKADANGNEIFTSYGFDLKHLLLRRIIAYAVGSNEALKSGLSEVVAKAYARENAGNLVAVAAREFQDFSVAADAGIGVTWSGDRARQNLLEVLQEIAEDGGDFDILYNENPDGSFDEFEFQWYYPINGTDRTAGSGNDVVFSVERNNMLVPVSSFNRSKETNTIYVLGQGTGVGRNVRVVQDATLVDDSPWNRMETMRQASNEATDAGLDRIGEEWLETSIPRQKLSFQVLQRDGAIYGLDYFAGDIVTGIYRQTVDKRLSNVRVNVTETGESISVSVADVIRVS